VKVARQESETEHGAIPIEAGAFPAEVGAGSAQEMRPDERTSCISRRSGCRFGAGNATG
jgi:hypothetical protein